MDPGHPGVEEDDEQHGHRPESLDVGAEPAVAGSGAGLVRGLEGLRTDHPYASCSHALPPDRRHCSQRLERVRPSGEQPGLDGQGPQVGQGPGPDVGDDLGGAHPAQSGRVLG